MKVFIGEDRSCNLNYEHRKLFYKLLEKNCLTENPEEADAIVFAGTCCCSEYQLFSTIDYMMDILEKKKENAKVYMTGCMTREFNNDTILNRAKEWIRKNIDVVVPQGKVNMLLQMISETEFNNLNKDGFGYSYYSNEDVVNAYITQGCLHHCSFCKTTFQKYPLKSVSFEGAKQLVDSVDDLKVPTLSLKGTNVCQFGLDTCGKYMLPELLEYIETKKNIHTVSLVGFAFQDAIQNGFEQILANSKKKYYLSGSLESGRNGLLELMKKGFTSEEFVGFIERIRKTNDIDLLLNIISGFPTETKEDVKMTLEVLKKIKPYVVAICRYTNSPFIDSSKYEQLAPEIIQEHTRIYKNVLSRRRVRTIISGEGYQEN